MPSQTLYCRVTPGKTFEDSQCTEHPSSTEPISSSPSSSLLLSSCPPPCPFNGCAHCHAGRSHRIQLIHGSFRGILALYCHSGLYPLQCCLSRTVCLAVGKGARQNNNGFSCSAPSLLSFLSPGAYTTLILHPCPFKT